MANISELLHGTSPGHPSSTRIGELRAAIRERIPIAGEIAKQSGTELLSPRQSINTAGRFLKKELQAEAAIEAATEIDPLTGLLLPDGFNRRLLQEANRSFRTVKPFALIYLDVNGLKLINDMRGHPEGDKFIRSVGSILASKSRQSDIVGRGARKGDEFSVLLPDSNEESARHWWDNLEEPFAENGIVLGAGLRVIEPQDVGANASERPQRLAALTREAEIALYFAKFLSREDGTCVMMSYDEKIASYLAKAHDTVSEERAG